MLFPVSRHLLNFKISTVTTTAWCHPTSTVAVKTANTAVCEHQLTPREYPCTDPPPPPLPVQPPPPLAPEIGHVASRACSGIRHERLSTSAAVRHRSASSEAHFTTAPKPIMDFTTWLWMFVFGYKPSDISFHSRIFGHRDPVSGGRRFRGSWGFFGIDNFWNPSYVC